MWWHGAKKWRDLADALGFFDTGLFIYFLNKYTNLMSKTEQISVEISKKIKKKLINGH